MWGERVHSTCKGAIVIRSRSSSVKRPLSATILVLALLSTLAQPLRTGWACPDGTACVASHEKRFVCAGNQCATEKSCCVKEHPTACKHGAFPGQDRTPASGSSVQTTDHCRFSISAPTHLTALTTDRATVAVTHVALAVPIFATLVASLPAPVWRSELTLGYRPPPALSTGPSRAPPTA